MPPAKHKAKTGKNSTLNVPPEEGVSSPAGAVAAGPRLIDITTKNGVRRGHGDSHGGTYKQIEE
jgi:hypothetical protein